MKTAHHLLAGRYQLGELLGYGGMAEVHRGLDLRLGRDVAIKILRTDLARDAAFLQRFRREAQNAAALNHPAIVAVYDTGEEISATGEKLPFIVMEFVNGRTLKEVLAAEQRILPRRALEMIADICAALEFSHRHGIIHRDIKPGNVMVTQNGQVKVMDFGIARARMDPDEDEGAVIGTAQYISPEQARGESVDARSDVYAAGCVLFELLVGHPPFVGDSPVSVAYQHVREDPKAPSDINREVPPDVDAIVLKALAKNPLNRYQSAQEMRADALRAASGRPVVASRDLRDGYGSPSPQIGASVSQAATQYSAAGQGWTPEPWSSWSPDDFTIELRHTFRYVNEPLIDCAPPIRLLGHGDLIASILERVRYSTGGAFLLGGYRGSGKTTLVRQVAQQLEQERDRTYVFVTIDVARPISSREFLLTITRRLFERIADSELMSRLRPDVRQALALAYHRTSMTIALKEAMTRERTQSMAISAKFPLTAGGVSLGGNAQQVRKTTRSHAEEASYLAYTESDIEHDFVRIVTLLASVPLRPRSPWSWPWRRPDPPVHVVIVVDELDKLTIDDHGTASLNEILVSLKNVLTTSGIHTLFVGGTELLDAAAMDAYEGIGIYESIFSWTAYVPCLWRSPEDLLSDIAPSSNSQQQVTTFVNYLQYKTRGIPRRLLQEVNTHVRWRGDRPAIVVATEDQEKIELYADLAATVESYLGDHLGDKYSSMRDDRFRLGAYYVLDWILRSEGDVFDAQQISTGERGTGAVLPVSGSVIEAFLEHLTDYAVIDRLSRETALQTMVSASRAETRPTYRLSKTVRERLMKVAKTNQRERLMLLGIPLTAPVAGDRDIDADRTGTRVRPSDPGPADLNSTTLVISAANGRSDLVDAVAEPSNTAPADPPSRSDEALMPDEEPNYVLPRSGRTLANGRYELIDVLGTGSMSTVYLGQDVLTGKEVAVKVLRESMAEDPEVRNRFIREAATVKDLDLHHRSVARIHELVIEPDGRLAIVMERVHGSLLDARITAEPRLSAFEAATICTRLLEAVQYLHDRGLFRLDIKPTNIVLRNDADPVIVDLGLAKQVNASHETAVGVLVGTATYMAPEQITKEPTDHRVDVYALGLVLFEMLSGRPLDVGSGLREVLDRRLNQDLPVNRLSCSPQLRDVVRRMTARRLEDRYGTADQARSALLATPDAGAGARATAAVAPGS